MSISDLRQSYENAPRLNRSDLADSPFDQFQAWFQQAIDAKIMEPNAMTLATVGPDGTPDARVVLLKDADKRGFNFYTNYLSAKANQISHAPTVSLVFYWDVLFRQVRIRGAITKVDRAEADAYWQTRPRASQLGAIASHQSAVLENRAELEAAFEGAAQRFPDNQPIPLPDDWGGYRVIPSTIEFWQGQRSRLHDRLVYVRDAEGWQVKRLAP